MWHLRKIYARFIQLIHTTLFVTTDFSVTKLSRLENFPTLMFVIKRSLDLLYLLKYKRTKNVAYN